MSNTILLTSFSTWKPHQRSNAADDALLALRHHHPSLHFLRQLPVNVPVAKQMTIAKIQALQPQVILCCGMAETRTKLSLESRAIVNQHTYQTPFNLDQLAAGLRITEISDDAGRFVCNGLYYSILSYLQEHHPDKQALFIHVPLLTPENRSLILADFQIILERVIGRLEKLGPHQSFR